jgi:SAM-dependent methyltransferase
MYARDINSPLTKFSSKMLHSYLGFPEGKPITALDVKCGNGEVLVELTRGAHEAFRYGIEPNEYFARQASERFVRVCRTEYKSQSKITNEAFSMVVVNPIINHRFVDEIFSDYDPFKIPNFEKEERERILAQEAMKDQLDLGAEGMTEEERAKQQEEVEKKIQKAIQDREIAYRRALREQEKRMEMFRDDKFLLSMATKYLAPKGILIFITPKEFIDGQICFKLANNYEDITIVRLDDDEYEQQRKCIIIAKKRQRVERDEKLAYELIQNKYRPYKEIPVLSFQQTPLYQVPSKKKEDVINFRIGPITMEEALQTMRRSTLIDNYIKTFGTVLDNVMPEPPTQLHKGHVSLLLASGLLNGYIGTGPDQHLVKGSVVKMATEVTEEEETINGIESKTVEREFFHIGIKYLDRYGNFHRLL